MKTNSGTDRGDIPSNTKKKTGYVELDYKVKQKIDSVQKSDIRSDTRQGEVKTNVDKLRELRGKK